MSYTILEGDALTQLNALPDQSVNCCVTSPPYYGLRDYGIDGQAGLENTPEAFVENMVKIFREVKRVLRDDGTLWLNIGDSYAGYHGNKNKQIPSSANNGWTNGTNENLRSSTANKNGLKQKDLIGIPWRLAFALQADGWYLRQDIIWKKPNPMPESVKDRCTKAHEYIFLLSKKQKYYYDADAIKEPLKEKPHAPGNKKLDASRNDHDQMQKVWGKDGFKNKRSVWTVTTKPYKAAHFATFPPDLIEPCILAGCPEGGTVLDPFNGSGTTLAVANQHNRNGIGIELNPDYIELAHQRIADHLAKHQPKLAV